MTVVRADQDESTIRHLHDLHQPRLAEHLHRSQASGSKTLLDSADEVLLGKVCVRARTCQSPGCSQWSISFSKGHNASGQTEKHQEYGSCQAENEMDAQQHRTSSHISR